MKKNYDKPRQQIKKQRYYFANKGPASKIYGFSSSYVWMGELDHKESWALKNWCFWTVRRLLRVSWTARRSNQSMLKEISPKYSLEGLMLKLKLQFFCHLMRRDDSLGREKEKKKKPDAGKDWMQKEKRAEEDEMAREHHWLNEHEFEQISGDSKGQGSLMCCSPLGHKETKLRDWTRTGYFE